MPRGVRSSRRGPLGGAVVLLVAMALAGLLRPAAFVGGVRTAGAPRRDAALRRGVAPGGGQAPEGKDAKATAERAAAARRETPKEQNPLEAWLESKRELFSEGALFNPARTFTRRAAIEYGAQFGEVGSFATLAVVGAEKTGMIARTMQGMAPLEDSIMLEQAGRLVPMVSGLLWPAAQVIALGLTALAITIALLEELQRDRLAAIDVDVDQQRKRRFTAVAVLSACVALMVSPPIPGVTEV